MSASPRARDTIISTALDMFAGMGYDQVDMDDIVKKARVSRGLILYHFGNKTGVLREIFLRQQPHIMASLTPDEISDPPVKVLESLVRKWGDSLEKNLPFWQIYWPLQLRPDIIALADQCGISGAFELDRQRLQTLYHSLQHPDPKVSVEAFDAFRRGVSAGYLSHPGEYPLLSMLEVWVKKFCL